MRAAVIYYSMSGNCRYLAEEISRLTGACIIEIKPLKAYPSSGPARFIKGGKDAAWKFIDNLQIFSLLANVADVKSLVIHPASTTHSLLTEEELADQGIYPGTIRLSIGTEHIDDIIADLERGFAAV